MVCTVPCALWLWKIPLCWGGNIGGNKIRGKHNKTGFFPRYKVPSLNFLTWPPFFFRYSLCIFALLIMQLLAWFQHLYMNSRNWALQLRRSTNSPCMSLTAHFESLAVLQWFAHSHTDCARTTHITGLTHYIWQQDKDHAAHEQHQVLTTQLAQLVCTQSMTVCTQGIKKKKRTTSMPATCRYFTFFAARKSTAFARLLHYRVTRIRDQSRDFAG